MALFSGRSVGNRLGSSCLRFMKLLDKKEKEIAMAKKKTVKFDYTDGLKVKKSLDGKAFLLSSPVDVKLPVNTAVTINSGVSCDLPVLFTSSPLETPDVHLQNKGTILLGPLNATLVNKTTSVMHVSAGETLVRFIVVGADAPDLDVE